MAFKRLSVLGTDVYTAVFAHRRERSRFESISDVIPEDSVDFDEDYGMDKEQPVLEGSLKVSTKIRTPRKVMSCDSLPKKHLMAVGMANGLIDIIGIRSHRVKQSFLDVPLGQEGLPATGLSFLHFSENPLLLASYSSGLTCLWNCNSGISEWNILEDRQTLVNRIKPDGSCFAAAGTDNKITLYDMETQSLIRTFESSLDPEVMDGHTMRIFDVSFHPENTNEFLTGGWDNTVQFWDIRIPQSVRKIFGPHICGDGIQFLKNGKEVLTASWAKNDALQVWDYEQGALIEVIKPDDVMCFLYSCRYVEEGNFIAAGGCNENMFRVVDLNTKITAGIYRHLREAVCFVQPLPHHSRSDVSYHIAVGSGSLVYILDVLL